MWLQLAVGFPTILTLSMRVCASLRHALPLAGPCQTSPARQHQQAACITRCPVRTRACYLGKRATSTNLASGPWRWVTGSSRGSAMCAINRPGVADDTAIDYSGPKATLDSNTVWRLQLGLQEGLPPAVIKIKFDRDEGYEPPQGVIEVIEDESGLMEEGVVNRWELGEDPDKKSENPMDGGGLWIWALFSETPFPCMLFSIKLNEFGAVYAKVPHAQGPKRGTVLSEGEITTRTVVDVAADLIGLSRAQIQETQPAGTIRIAPVDRY